MTRYRYHPGSEPQVWPVSSCPELLKEKGGCIHLVCYQLYCQLMYPLLLLYFSNYSRLLPPPIPTVYTLHSTSMCWNYWSIYTQREEKKRDAPPKRHNASPTLPLRWSRCRNYVTFELVKRHLGSVQNRTTFAPPTFEDNERLQAHGNGIGIRLPWDNLYQEHKRETATWRKQIRIPSQPACPIYLETDCLLFWNLYLWFPF